MKNFSIFLFLLSGAVSLQAQIAFKQGYGTQNHDIPCSVQQTASNGYIMMGFTAQTNPYMNNYLIMCDEYGDTLWSRNYFNPESERPTDMTITSDGGFIVAGSIYSQAWGGCDIEVMKMDSAGNFEWAFRYGETNRYETAMRVVETSDGSFLLTGRCDTAWDGTQYGFLMKLHPDGTLIWFKRYKHPDDRYIELYGVTEANNGDYVACGYYVGDSSYSALLFRTDTSGTVLWEKEYYSGAQIIGRDVKEYPNGDLIMYGLHYNSSSGHSEFCLLKTASDGNLLWAKNYTGLPDNADGYRFDMNASGALCLAGSVYMNNNWHQGVATFIDTAGNHAGAFHYETEHTVYYQDVVAANDGGWTILALEDSMFSNNDVGSFRLIKTAASGIAPCGMYGYPCATLIMNVVVESNGLVTNPVPITINAVAVTTYSGNEVLPICPVSVNENNADASVVSVYPNPATDFVTIESPFEEAVFSLYNSLGQIVYTENITAMRTEISVMDFAEGVYFYRLESEGLVRSSGKLVLE